MTTETEPPKLTVKLFNDLLRATDHLTHFVNDPAHAGYDAHHQLEALHAQSDIRSLRAALSELWPIVVDATK